MARNDGEEGKERRVGRTYKSSDVHRRTSNFKAIRGSKQPAREAAPEAASEAAPEAAARPQSRSTRNAAAQARMRETRGGAPEASDQDFLLPMRMSDEELGEALRPIERPRWDERAGRYRDAAPSGRVPAVNPEQIPAVQMDAPQAAPAAASVESADMAGGPQTPAPADGGEGAAAPAARTGRAARTPYAPRANDAFARTGRRFDAENAPEVPLLGEDDFDEEGQWVEGDEPDSATPSRVRRVRELDKPKRRVGRIIAIIITALLLVALAVFGIFGWNRWLRYDDVADFQGQWYADGTSTPVTIESDTIRLTPDVAYLYELDTMSKTMTFSFGKLEGHARYWFEDDRSRLVIVDGEGYTAVNTFIEDFERIVTGFIVRTGGSSVQLPEGQDVIVLSRTPTAAPAQPAASTSAAAVPPTDGGQEASAESPEPSAEAPASSEAAAEPGQEPAASPSAASPSASAASASSSQSSGDAAAKGRQMLSVSDILAELPSADEAAQG